MRMYSVAVGLAFAFLVALIAILGPVVAQAQQDGPCGYMLSPEGVHGVILTGYYLSANQATDKKIQDDVGVSSLQEPTGRICVALL